MRLKPPPLLGFCLGWSSNFVSSESGQIQSVKLLQNMVSNRTPSPHTPPPHLRTVQYLYILIKYTDSHREGGGGEWNQRERERGNGESTDHKAGLKIPTRLNDVRKKLAISSL
jgi:hypothetical protein